MAPPLDSQLTPLCAQVQTAFDLPGLAIGVVQDGQVAYTGAWGVRSIATQEPVTPRSLFHMASVSKLFVTTAVMQLCERERALTNLREAQRLSPDNKDVAELLAASSRLPADNQGIGHPYQAGSSSR